MDLVAVSTSVIAERIAARRQEPQRSSSGVPHSRRFQRGWGPSRDEALIRLTPANGGNPSRKANQRNSNTPPFSVHRIVPGLPFGTVDRILFNTSCDVRSWPNGRSEPWLSDPQNAGEYTKIRVDRKVTFLRDSSNFRSKQRLARNRGIGFPWTTETGESTI